MEPLSTLATVIAIAGAVRKLSKFLCKVVNIRNAPDVLLALNNEISDLHLVLDDVNDLLASTRRLPPRSLGTALERVKSTVLQLEKFVAYELTNVDSTTGRICIHKSTFFRKEQRLQQFKNNVRVDRNDLSSALSLFATFLSIDNGCQLRATHCSIEILSKRLDDLEQQPDPESQSAEPSRGSNSTALRKSDYKYQPYHPTKIQVSKVASTCDDGCLCSCHRYNRIRSPTFLDNILGKLFIGYRANALRQACSNAGCRTRAGGFVTTYAFPSWLLKYAISISSSSMLSTGPEFLLRLMRERDFTPINRVMHSSSKSWSLDEMQRMLDFGLASVLDINKEGESVLYYAVRNRKWPIARLLISYGADINYENNRSLSPFVKTWTDRFSSNMQIPGDVLEDWDSLFFQDRSQIDVFGFSNLHKAYLGLSGRDFGQVLACTDRFDNADSLGRTVLCWAAIRGDPITVAQLLSIGSNPNQQDKNGWIPLFYALQVDEKTSQILLDAESDPKILGYDGSTPLHCVAEKNTCLIKRIVDYGADINRRNNEGATALHYACLEDRHKLVRELLACGADINSRDNHGNTEVIRAVWLNSYRSLPSLISDPSFDQGTTNWFGWDFSTFVVSYADVQTLQVLANEWPAGMEFGRVGEENTLWKYARCRRDEDPEWCPKLFKYPDPDPVAWFDAFTDMMTTLVKRRAHEFDDSASQDEGWEDAREHCENNN